MLTFSVGYEKREDATERQTREKEREKQTREEKREKYLIGIEQNIMRFETLRLAREQNDARIPFEQQIGLKK
jgi:hypothetical protein